MTDTSNDSHGVPLAAAAMGNALCQLSTRINALERDYGRRIESVESKSDEHSSRLNAQMQILRRVEESAARTEGRLNGFILKHEKEHERTAQKAPQSDCSVVIDDDGRVVGINATPAGKPVAFHVDSVGCTNSSNVQSPDKYSALATKNQELHKQLVDSRREVDDLQLQLTVYRKRLAETMVARDLHFQELTLIRASLIKGELT